MLGSARLAGHRAGADVGRSGGAARGRTRTVFLLAASMAVAQTAFAQARVVSEPSEPSLLSLTRGWSRASSLGDLREARTRPDHLELRVWAGYDSSTTQAIAIRRAEGRWSAFVARVLRCELQVPVAVYDTASAATMRQFVAEARRHCGTTVRDIGAGARIITADTVVVAQLALPDSTIERAWNAAVSAGVLDMPGRAQRAAPPGDGFTYVIETRRGNDYRASEIERVEPPATDADRAVQQVYAALRRLMGAGSPDSSVRPPA